MPILLVVGGTVCAEQATPLGEFTGGVANGAGGVLGGPTRSNRAPTQLSGLAQAVALGDTPSPWMGADAGGARQGADAS